jgi:hypothetical protein
MHNLFLVYFVNLYMFRAYLGPHQEVQTYVYYNWFLLFLLDDCLLSWLDLNSKGTALFRNVGKYIHIDKT